MTIFVPEWIWGSADETTVYVQGYGAGLTDSFRLKANGAAGSQSLVDRIVKYYHASSPRVSAVANPTAADFVNRNEMRAAVWAAVREVWPHVITDPNISAIDAVVDLNNAGGKGIGQPWMTSITEFVPFEDLIRHNHLGGRGCSTKVRRKNDKAEFSVFKGLDFRTFLNYSDGETNSPIRGMIKVWHHANNLVAQMPKHPRVLAPTATAVTLTLNAGAKVICGCLWPYLSQGDMGSRLKKSREDNLRLPLELKKR